MSNTGSDAIGDLTELERRLSGWRPAGPGSLDRDRLLFEAGRAAAIPAWDRALWRFAVAALVFLNVGLGGLLLRSMLHRDRAERALIAQVQALHEAQAALAVARANPVESHHDAAEPPPVRGPAELRPSSYLVLSRHLASVGPESAYDSPIPAVGPGRVIVDAESVFSPLMSRVPGASFDL